MKLQVIHKAMRKSLEAQHARGHLTGPQTHVMEVVCRHGGVSLKDLSKAVNLAHSTVSGIVDRLEKRGFLVRTPFPSDRRVTQILPSRAVSEFLQKRAPALRQHPLTVALKKASPTERRSITRGISTLEKLLTRK